MLAVAAGFLAVSGAAAGAVESFAVDKTMTDEKSIEGINPWDRSQVNVPAYGKQGTNVTDSNSAAHTANSVSLESCNTGIGAGLTASGVVSSVLGNVLGATSILGGGQLANSGGAGGAVGTATGLGAAGGGALGALGGLGGLGLGGAKP